MWRLVELPLTGDAHVAAVRKVDPRAEAPHHRGQVVLGEGAERARAERYAVGGTVDELQESLQVPPAADNPRQPEDGPGWIVRVDRHPHARLFGGGDDALEEVGEMIPQPLGVDLTVCSEECTQLVCPIDRGPPREIPNPEPQVPRHERRIVVGERGRSVGQPHREIGAHPVEHGHEVVTQHPYAQLAHGANALAVVRDQAVARRPSELDVFVDRNALDDRELEPCVRDVLLQAREPVLRPALADRHVVQRAHDALDAGNLADMRQRDRVRLPEPAEGHVHRTVSTRRFTSGVVDRPKSPAWPSFRAPAAAANSTASCGDRSASRAAIRPAVKLSPPPTRSTTCTTCLWARTTARVALSYSTALHACAPGPRISRSVMATARQPNRSASSSPLASLPSIARTASRFPMSTLAWRARGP